MKISASPAAAKTHFYPTNQVVAVIDEGADVAAVRSELDRAGFAADAVEVMAGADGLRRLDASGARHGVAGRLLRLIQGYGDMEQMTFSRQADALRAGHSLVGVLVRGTEQRRRAGLILKRHHGHFMNFFGRWTITGMYA